MLTKLQKWGNSQGLRLSKEILSSLHLAVGDEVEVSVEQGRIVIEPVTQIRGKYSLKALVREIPANYQVQEENWGQAAGKEVW
ncbi:MAG: AbrB/MazE/SpoVT family DNA-binding domain-containing protein [Candidatus Sericytochromatia bacterium]|nr:AbrB/MazE/SpoVT family DNA-binding domain-containing protein [Candidatus Sericytochromatia bacterium]